MTSAVARERTDWFAAARFGMFIHFGLYSLAARHEWVRSREKLSDQQYRRYFDHFTVDRLDVRQWVQTAVDAGARYVVLTAKHHDGFCLWDSAHTDFSSAHAPASRDIVAEFVAAARDAGLRVGLYYSLIDWNHPDFPIDGLHPDWDPATAEQRNAGRIGARYAGYLQAQVTELLERFDPDLLWFDFSYPGDALAPGGKGRDFWRSAELVEKIRGLKPDIILNDRLDLPGSEDFLTPEDVQPQHLRGPLWEACRTINGSWGYAPEFRNWLSAEQVVGLLVDSVSQGGNLLLNTGPNGRGELDPRARRLLAEVGAWTELHEPSVYGAGPAQLAAPSGCSLTRRDDRLFLHVTGGWPAGHLVLTGLPRPLAYASFLHDGAEVQFAVVGAAAPTVPHEVPAGPPGSTVLALPVSRPEVAVPVIELALVRP